MMPVVTKRETRVSVLTSPTVSAGYERLTGPRYSAYAVRWWYVCALDDGTVWFARGGRVRKARDARREIAQAAGIAQHEAKLRQHIPTHRLTKTGDLEPL